MIDPDWIAKFITDDPDVFSEGLVRAPDGNEYDGEWPAIFISDSRGGDKLVIVPNGDLAKIIPLAKGRLHWAEGVEVDTLSNLLNYPMDWSAYENADSPLRVIKTDFSTLLNLLHDIQQPPPGTNFTTDHIGTPPTSSDEKYNPNWSDGVGDWTPDNPDDWKQ